METKTSHSHITGGEYDNGLAVDSGTDSIDGIQSKRQLEVLGDQPPGKMADRRFIFKLSQDGLQIFFRCFNGHNVKLVHQNIENVGRDKRR